MECPACYTEDVSSTDMDGSTVHVCNNCGFEWG